MAIYEIFLKNKSTDIFIKTDSKEEALLKFKNQRLYQKGISKNDYTAKQYKH